YEYQQHYCCHPRNRCSRVYSGSLDRTASPIDPASLVEGHPMTSPDTATIQDQTGSDFLDDSTITKGFAHLHRGLQHDHERISFSITEGEFVAIIGPSGSGKSTLLKMIAGLQTPDEGTIQLAGEPITKPGRRLGVVFQQHVLLPWLS